MFSVVAIGSLNSLSLNWNILDCSATDIKENNPFVGVEIIKTDHHLETSVYRKKTNRGLLLHYQSHVDFRYKWSLLMTLPNRNRSSSSPYLLSKECRNLKAVFLKLNYTERLINSPISRFNHSLAQDQTQTVSTVTKDNPIRIILPFKDQISADIVRRDLRRSTKLYNPSLRVGNSSKTWEWQRINQHQ